MEWLFAEPAPPAWPIAGLAVSILGVVGGRIARRRAARLEGTVLQVFWHDAATIAITMAGVTGVAALAAIVPVEGLGQPIWIVVGAVAALAAVALLVFRWRTQELGMASRRRPLAPTAAPERRLISTGWEVGMLGAGIGGLATYLVTAGHLFGHPIHWVIAGLGLFVGYALGIGFTTPRFRLEAPTRRRT